MADEVVLAGKQYISSKRASELSGYTQDYIGQLSRGAEIDAQRVGGLWYISLDSLNAYKTNADTYKPEPPQRTYGQGLETVVSFDGKDYVSASRGAEITGYHQDYIGQLARGGKISSRQVGNRWFIDRHALIQHKSQKDSLLAEVQSQAVGIRRESEHGNISNDESYLTYTREDGDLLPTISKSDPEEVAISEHTAEHHLQANKVPIRVISAPKQDYYRASQQATSMHASTAGIRQPGQAASGAKTIAKLALLGASVFTVVIFVLVGFTSLQDHATYALSGSILDSSMTAATGNALRALSEAIEDLLAHQVSYQRIN